MNDISGDGTGSFKVKIRTNAAKFTNMTIARFRESRYLVRESEEFVKNKTKFCKQNEWKVSCTTIAQIQGVLQKLSNLVFYNFDYHFLTENYFSTMYTTILSYSVGGGFTGNNDGTHNFFEGARAPCKILVPWLWPGSQKILAPPLIDLIFHCFQMLPNAVYICRWKILDR